MVADHQGGRYLVSMLGEGTNWVRNVRGPIAGWCCTGHREVVHLEEVNPGERAAILRRYLECAPGARSHIPVDRRAPIEEFQAVSGQYPVFRLTVP